MLNLQSKHKSILGMVAIVAILGLAGLGYFKEHNEKRHSERVKTRADVEKVIQEYILEKPELLEDAMKILYMRKQQAETEKSQQAVKQRMSQLVDEPTDPRTGSTAPTVTIVEFFDYNCGYCKRMIGTEKQILNELKSVRIIFKEFPILGENSRMLAKAALAVNAANPELYYAFHTKIMESEKQVSNSDADQIAKNIGVDMGKYKAALNGDALDKKLADNFLLASDLGLRGTPAYIIGDQLAPGALSFEEVKKMVAGSSANSN